MKLGTLISELNHLPKDKLLYDSINMPSWYVGNDGAVVLAGSPCPVQTVEQLIHKLKLIQGKDLPSQDHTFRNVVYEDTEVYASVATLRRGIYNLLAEVINATTIKHWQNYSTDHMQVDVAFGGPSYILSSDKVKVLVNKPYYNLLGINGKRRYLEELLAVHAYSWIDENGKQYWMNKEYWLNLPKCDCNHDPVLELKDHVKGFEEVRR